MITFEWFEDRPPGVCSTPACAVLCHAVLCRAVLLFARFFLGIPLSAENFIMAFVLPPYRTAPHCTAPQEYWKRGYEEVTTPNMYNMDLWQQSGHAAHYKDAMFRFPVEGQEFGACCVLRPVPCVLRSEFLGEMREKGRRFLLGALYWIS